MLFSIVGDGLAGLMLALRLRSEGHQVAVYGDNQSNTPPVAMVHLFAGRTFRRSPLELAAFERAVLHWRQEPLAREMSVRRRVEPGGRLDRSAESHPIPDDYAPRRCEGDWMEYRPGFSVAARRLEQRLRSELEVRPGLRALDSVPGPRLLALGLRARDFFPGVGWDVSPGALELAPAPPGRPAIIEIGLGVHAVTSPEGDKIAYGGSGGAFAGPDRKQRLRELTGSTYQPGVVWEGTRCAPARDRLPLLGWLDPENFAFVGFGSRALFWLPFCLDLAVAALDGAPIPPELDVRRLPTLSGLP